MTNKERQKSLDKKKWVASEKQKFDMSGFMAYCEYCNKRGGLHGECQTSQEERETKCLCATAWNRKERKEAKK